MNTFVYSQIPTSGLIGGWTFSGNANDNVGNNHGTVFNASLTTDRCGNPNSAYSFNGSSSYIVTSQLGPIGNASRSVSFWARTTNTVIQNPVVSFDYGLNSGNSDTYQIVWNYCGHGVGLDLSNQALIRGDICLLDGRWHHIVSVFNSSVSSVYSTVSYYIDGVLQPAISCNVSGTNASINTGTVFPITFGRGVTPVRYWLGDLDDFYLYNRPLTQQEVLQLYNNGPCAPPIFGDTLVCPQTTHVYSLNPISNASYTWTLPNGWSGTSTSNTILATSGFSGGVISVSFSSSCAPLTTSTLAVNILPDNSISIQANQPTVCAGQSVTLSLTGTPTATWLPPPTLTVGPQIIVTPTATTIYTAHVNHLGCNLFKTYTLYVSGSASLTIHTGTNPSCSGQPVTLTVTGGSSYQWSPGAQTTSVITVYPAVSTVYTVIGSAGTCTGIATKTVFVVSQPTVSVSADTQTACTGAIISLTATAAGGTPGYNFLWAGGPASPVYNSTSSNPGNIIQNVSVTDANGCSSTSSIALTFFQTPVLSVSSQSICSGSTGMLSVSGSSSYTWLPSGTTGNTLSDNPAVTTIYTVMSEDGGCVATKTAAIFIHQLPLINVFTPTVNCGVVILSATVTAHSGTGPYNYTWSPGPFTGSAVSGLSPGTYTISVSDNGTGCLASYTTPYNPPVSAVGLPTISISGDTSVCQNSILSLKAEGGMYYNWKGPYNINSSQQTLSFKVTDTLSSGIYTVSVQNASLCSASKTVQISVNSVPHATLTGTRAGCAPFCTYIHLREGKNKAPIESTSYQIGQSVNHQADRYCFNHPGNYFMIATFRDTNDCVNSSTMSISVYEKPVANFEVSPDNPMANEDKVYFYNTSSGNGINSYNWFVNGSMNDTITAPNHFHTYEQPGHYPVVLVAKNIWGCADTVIKSLIVSDLFQLYVPDAFTPNDDGINDIFIPKGQGIKKYTLEVFNRWGEQIFYTPDAFTGWDGTFHEKRCKADAYTWKIILNDAVGKQRTLTGVVNLIR